MKKILISFIFTLGLFGFSYAANALTITGNPQEIREFVLQGGSSEILGATYLFPSGGGTGTSTNPTYGQMLVGNAGGTYTLTATSSLGIAATVTALDDIGDVTITAAAFGDLVAWNGSAWVDIATSTLEVALSDTKGTLTVARGGTGLTTFGGTNTLLYTTAADTLSSITIGTGGQMLAVLNGTPTWTGTSTFIVDDDFSTNGFMVRTASGSYTSKTIATSTDHIIVVNPDGVSGNPTLTVRESAFTSLSSLATIGILTGGTLALDSLSFTGNLNHEYGGLEFDASAITTGGFLRGASAGAFEILGLGTAGQLLGSISGQLGYISSSTMVLAGDIQGTLGATTIGTDVVDDTHIDWGTGAGQISVADLSGNQVSGALVWDFGGATSLEAPNASNPTVNVSGEYAVNTATGSSTAWVYFDGTNEISVNSRVPLFGATIASSTLEAYNGLLATSTISLGTSWFGENISTIRCYATSTGSVMIRLNNNDFVCNQNTDDKSANINVRSGRLREVQIGTSSGTWKDLVIQALGRVFTDAD